jgi:hypothetical protein
MHHLNTISLNVCVFFCNLLSLSLTLSLYIFFNFVSYIFLHRALLCMFEEENTSANFSRRHLSRFSLVPNQRRWTHTHPYVGRSPFYSIEHFFSIPHSLSSYVFLMLYIFCRHRRLLLLPRYIAEKRNEPPRNAFSRYLLIRAELNE